MFIKVSFKVSGDGCNGMGCVPEPGEHYADPIEWEVGVEANSDSEAIACWDPFQNGFLCWLPPPS